MIRYRVLESLVTIVGGGTPSKANPNYFTGTLPWVSPKDMKTWEIHDTEDHITKEALSNSSTKLVNAGAVLVVIRSGVLKHSLPIAINRVGVALNQDIKALVCGPEILPEYLARALQSLAPKLLQTVRGTTADNISTDVLRRLEVPLPPLAEQKRIAAVLEKADGLRAKRQQAIDTLDSLLHSVFLDMFGDCTSANTRWPRRPMGTLVASTQLGLVRSSEEFGPDYPFPYVRMNAISASGRLDHHLVLRTNATQEEIEQCRLLPGDLLFNTRNSRDLVGKSAIFEGNGVHLFNNNIMRIRFRPCVDPYFVLGYLQTRAGGASLDLIKSGTTSVFAIYWSKLKDLAIPVPPLETQTEYSRKVSVVGAQRARQLEAATRLHDLFSSLQSAAFSGTLFCSPSAPLQRFPVC